MDLSSWLGPRQLGQLSASADEVNNIAAVIAKEIRAKTRVEKFMPANQPKVFKD